MTLYGGLSRGDRMPLPRQVVQLILCHVDLMMEALAVRLRDYPRLALAVLLYLYHSSGRLLP